MHLDGTFLAGHDGLLGVAGSGAAAGGFHIGEDERLVALIDEGEHAVTVGSLLDSTVVVLGLGETNLGAICGHFLGLSGLRIGHAKCHRSKKAD